MAPQISLESQDKLNWLMEMAFAILTEVTGDVVGHLTRYGRVGGCRCHVLPQLRRLVCLPLGLEDVISFSDFSAFTLAKYLSLMFSDTETLMSSLVGVATRSPRPLVHPPYLSRSWQHSILHNFVWDGLVELGEHFLELFVSKALPKVLDEDVADTAPPEGGVTLAPHDPSLGTPRRCAQPRQSWGLSCRGSLDVINNVNCDHWRSLDDGDCLENLLLVVLGVRAVHLVSSHIIKHEQHKQTHMNTNYEYNINIIWTFYKHKQNLGC